MKTIRSITPTIASQLDNAVQYAELKRLAENVISIQQQKAFRTLAVLSMHPAEGKTLFTAALAMAYTSVSPSKALVVDTTTVQDSQSLVLKQCLSSHQAIIDFMSLEDFRRGTNGNGSAHTPHASTKDWYMQSPALEADMVSDGSVTLVVKKKSDQSLIQAVSNERAIHYGLVLLDTAPIAARNKGNIDPLLVARMADASILIVSPRLLNDPGLDEHMKILRDNRLHLIGIVSNEEFFQ